MKIINIVGARPQFIKAATVSRAIAKIDGDKEVILHTGQHFDDNMSQIFFDELQIPIPNYNLGIGGGSHGQNTGRMIEHIEAALVEERPDYVIVYGDTDSTLAGALAAAKLHIPVAHVEAGLRSYNRQMPEEINRVLTDHSSSLLFAPTQTAILNLAKEGIAGDNVYRVGDVMYDAAIFFAAKAELKSRILSHFELTKKKFILATLHRAENTDNIERLHAILVALNRVAEEGVQIVWPLHPRTRSKLSEMRFNISDSVRTTEPVGYLDMVLLEKYAAVVVTDSGGVQKEAFFHGTPCVTLRTETEWLELVQLGWNRLASPVPTADAVTRIVHTIHEAMNSSPQPGQNPFGTGDSAEQITNTLRKGFEYKQHQSQQR